MKKVLYCITLVATFSSCMYRRAPTLEEKLVSIQLVDRHGVRETISTKERLHWYEKNNFLSFQPYDKVVRIFTRNPEGKSVSKLTSYHENGQVKQYLEVIGGRAKGIYEEWYENGQTKVKLYVIEGAGDLGMTALQTFVVDGISEAFDERGNILARISYNKGVLDGTSLYYYPNGQVKTESPYHNGSLHGLVIWYNEEGEKITEMNYQKGLIEGDVCFQGNKEVPSFQERYAEGSLSFGRYFDFQDQIVSEVNDGIGIKSFFACGKLVKQCEILQGRAQGKVQLFDIEGRVDNIYYINKEEEKHGEEWVYYQGTDLVKLQLTWLEGEVHGVVKTWYENGKIESEKEFSHNKKQGMHFIWYRDGSLMSLEEYENDLLKKGKYFKKGVENPISTISDGTGIATLYDSFGSFLRKIEYQSGTPFDSEDS